MEKRFSTCLFLGLALAACGDDGYDYLPPGDDEPDAEVPDSGLPTDGDVRPDMAGDGVAPLITLVSPEEGALVSGVVTIAVDVTDGDGVESVTATITDDTIPFLRGANDRWSGMYDTYPLSGLVTPTVVVRARDFAGTESTLGFQVNLDNEPPWSSLDPPRVREARYDQGLLGCSRSFDPLGGDAADDGESVAQLIELRARVVDIGNTGTQSTTLSIPNAGPATVELYVLDDTARPLVVDGDGDGFCDRINPEIVPSPTPDSANEAVVVDLSAVDPQGEPPLGAVDAFAGSNASVCDSGYTSSGTGLCTAEPTMTYAIQTTFDARPQVYGIPPVDSQNCTGWFVDAPAATLEDGWACAAVLAVDALGNASVSPPLRICIDKDGNGAEGCPAWTEIAPEDVRPDCTGTFDPDTMVVSSTPCLTVPGVDTFASSGVAGDYELVLVQ